MSSISDAASEGKGKWRRVTRAHPCPICGKDSWCGVSADGRLAACRRVEVGAWKSKTDKSGAPVYLHRLDGAGPALSVPPAPPSAGPAVERADPDMLHRAYSGLLARLQLAEQHREALRGRGLSDEVIDRGEYRTLPVQGRARLARALREELGDALLSVPGFVLKRGNDGRPFVTIAGAAGLLVPVREAAGRIVAMLSRRDDAGDGGGKYSYLSSIKYGGPGPGAPPHFPLGFPAAPEIVRLTEGTVKADVATALSGLPTIGCAGLAWRSALDALRALGARTVRLALDGDAADKAPVARALGACARALAAEGLAVELERWPGEHKGIDDALAAGAGVEVLTGDVARQAIADLLTEATAGEPAPPPPVSERLREALDGGGAEALYRDAALLRDLATLAESQPAEFACARARLRSAGVRLRNLDAALSPLRRELRAAQPPPDAAGLYRVAGGRIVRGVLTRDGAVSVPLANWAGRIVEEVLRDDGAERQLVLAVEGALADGTPLPRAELPAEDFPWMRWPVERWGTRAVVYAGAGTADHLRAAVQLLSGDVPRRTVYAHTGWREVGGGWCYLHAGGAIGADGPAGGVVVQLPDALAGYTLPDPPAGAELAAAIRASLAVLEVAPDRLTVPLLGAVYRAALGPADYALHLSGPTGALKTELATLCQQHWGAGMDARHLPGSWASTGNSLEALAFAAADALLVVDDFAPGGGTHDVARMHREADRLLRAQGNRSGRARCRTDGTVRPARPPRGTALSTGEDVPRGQSLRARLLTLEQPLGEVLLDRLTACQRDAAAGLYAAALAGYVRWLAPGIATIRAGLRQETAALRERLQAEGLHPRTPGILADLAAGWRWWLDYALAAGAIDAAERQTRARRAWQALLAVGAEQAVHLADADPVELFLNLLADALASGRAHVAGPEGDRPPGAGGWGWRAVEVLTGHGPDTRWDPLGRRIGWLDGADDLYLAPQAAYAEAQELARQKGEALPLTALTLWRRLRERGLLASCEDGRQRLTVRRHLGGARRYVIHLRAETLCAGQPAQPAQPAPDTAGMRPDGAGCGAGRTPDPAQPAPPTGPADRNGNAAGAVPGSVGPVAHPIDGPGAQNNAPQAKRRRGRL
jgi:hypothetical protein